MNKNVKGYVLSTLLSVSVISIGINWNQNTESYEYVEEDDEEDRPDDIRIKNTAIQ